MEEIEVVDRAGLDAFGIGEHHRADFDDSAPTMILAAAAARTTNIRLHSAVTVLSAVDPVRLFQEFATLDVLSQGRAEIVVDAYPLFGLDLEQYDALFIEKLGLLTRSSRPDPFHLVGQVPTYADQSTLAWALSGVTPIHRSLLTSNSTSMGR